MSTETFDQMIQREILNVINTKSDINEHIQDLYNLACQCNHVTEMGTRFGASTKAFLKAPVTLRAYDINIHEPLMEIFKAARDAGKDVNYIKANVHNIVIEPTDLLFIDTWHCQENLRKELRMHGNLAKRYIVLHDTHTYGTNDEVMGQNTNPNKSPVAGQGLLAAVIDFVIANPHWYFKMHKTNCNGLTVLERRRRG